MMGSSTHRGCMRDITNRVSWRSTMVQCVPSLTDLPDIASVIAPRRNALFGHVRRLSPDTRAHKALRLAVQLRQGTHLDAWWRRLPSRPRYTWISQLEQGTGISADQLWKIAADRMERAALRPSAGSRNGWWWWWWWWRSGTAFPHLSVCMYVWSCHYAAFHAK